MRLLLLTVVVGGVVLGAGCSDDDADSSAADDTTSLLSTTDGPGSSTTTAPAVATSTDAPPPTVAESAGWRLVVTQPTAGATVSPNPTLCTEVSGPSREPVVVLEVTVDGETERVTGSVGRAQVRPALATTGTHDVQVQLIADGQLVDGVVVTIPAVTFTDGVDDPTSCA